MSDYVVVNTSCGKVKNPCKICLTQTSKKNGLQCQGACKRWAHYSCLGYTPGKISDIKKGIIKVLCPCPDCNTAGPKELVKKSSKVCNNKDCPATKPQVCKVPSCPSSRLPTCQFPRCPSTRMPACQVPRCPSSRIPPCRTPRCPPQPPSCQIPRCSSPRLSPCQVPRCSSSNLPSCQVPRCPSDTPPCQVPRCPSQIPPCQVPCSSTPSCMDPCAPIPCPNQPDGCLGVAQTSCSKSDCRANISKDSLLRDYRDPRPPLPPCCPPSNPCPKCRMQKSCRKPKCTDTRDSSSSDSCMCDDQDCLKKKSDCKCSKKCKNKQASKRPQTSQCPSVTKAKGKLLSFCRGSHSDSLVNKAISDDTSLLYALQDMCQTVGKLSNRMKCLIDKLSK